MITTIERPPTKFHILNHARFQTLPPDDEGIIAWLNQHEQASNVTVDRRGDMVLITFDWTTTQEYSRIPDPHIEMGRFGYTGRLGNPSGNIVLTWCERRGGFFQV